ncbi:MAG: TusE/DsrC/DsvC family sulfur relay protein [Oleispira sp.]|jgi:tRNA 2-thiouridine synthesizing protein E|nr:TusE/DsrC/DsvC family sulfur relay protein [Oleispira sp.]
MIVPNVDKDGFLLDHLSWNEGIAMQLASNEGITLTADHWQLIRLIRQFHQEFDLSPAMRPLIKYIKLHLGKEKANSMYLMQLFPQSPAKYLAKIAGLPRPENCL